LLLWSKHSAESTESFPQPSDYDSAKTFVQLVACACVPRSQRTLEHCFNNSPNPIAALNSAGNNSSVDNLQAEIESLSRTSKSIGSVENLSSSAEISSSESDEVPISVKKTKQKTKNTSKRIALRHQRHGLVDINIEDPDELTKDTSGDSNNRFMSRIKAGQVN